MELSQRAINELISLKDEYERKERLANKKFIASVFEIVESEEKFHNLLCYEFSSDKAINPALAEDNKVIINGQNLLHFSKRNIRLFGEDFLEEEYFALRNIDVLWCLLHEISHVWQSNGLDDYAEINRLYKEIWQTSNNLYYRVTYELFRNKFSFERHANVDAYRELGRIYDGTMFQKVPCIFHMYYLTYLYGILSPVEKTLLMTLIKNDFNTEGIPNYKLIEVGFRVDDDVLKRLNDITIMEAKGKIVYNEALRLVKKL